MDFPEFSFDYDPNKKLLTPEMFNNSFDTNEDLSSVQYDIFSSSQTCDPISFNNNYETSQEIIKPQQSPLKNANKYFLSTFLSFMANFKNNYNSFNNNNDELLKYIVRVKQTGKLQKRCNIYSLFHYRALFMTLNDWNINQLQSQDIYLHNIIFKEILQDKKHWDEQDLQKINEIKQKLFSEGHFFFSDESNFLSQKIILKYSHNQILQDGYLQWKSKLLTMIKKSNQGQYIYRV